MYEYELKHGGVRSARTGHVATVRGYDIFQDSPDGDAWFALAADGLDEGEEVVVHPSLGALIAAIRAAGAAPA